MKINLPKDFLPSNFRYKKLDTGLDLPAWFYDEIKSVDRNLHFVWHKYRLQYDDLMNNYYGSLEDPRWVINDEGWGWVLTDNMKVPIPENKWHIWSLAKDYGWCHVSNIASTEPEHLYRIVTRLGKEKAYKAMYGALEWNHRLRKDEEEREAKAQDAKDQQFQDIQKENSWLTRKAMENLDRGITAPSRPTKDIISSYSGQTNRSKITRPITDKEGGLIGLGEE